MFFQSYHSPEFLRKMSKSQKHKIKEAYFILGYSSSRTGITGLK